MKYYILMYVDNLSRGAAGRANGPLIRILKRYKGNKGLLEHEKFHVRQWWFTLGMHGFIKIFSKKYRLWSEARAYQIQREVNKGD
jgi:hypothetical protein